MKRIRLLIVATLAGTLCASAQPSTNAIEIITMQEVAEAAMRGQVEIIEKALTQNYDINLPDAQGRTVLMYAVYNNQTDIIKKLLSAGAKVSIKDSEGTTPITLANYRGHTALVSLLIDAALEQHEDVNSIDAEKRTMLMYAAFNGDAPSIKKLIAAGADVNAQDAIGTSALMFAASAPDSKESVTLLLDAGAQINMVDSNEHFSALMWAAAEGQIENVKLLLSKGADLTLKDVDSDTAESFAAKAGHTACAELLKKAAAESKEKEEPKE